MDLPRRGRPRRHPNWKEGEETTKQEKLWPYASCVIAGDVIKTQNIGVLKAMARDKAKNTNKEVPLVVFLPNGEKHTFIFRPTGTYVLLKIEEAAEDD